MHNDDPTAEKMWLPAGSFWTQPAGESHITAADGEENLIYLEIDSGPYLVLPTHEAFDNGERPVNLDKRNIVWLDSEDAAWVEQGHGAQVAYLWGNTSEQNGSFVKLPANFKGAIEGMPGLKAVIIKGEADYSWNNEEKTTQLTPTSFFSASVKGKHHLNVMDEVIIYISTTGKYKITSN